MENIDFSTFTTNELTQELGKISKINEPEKYKIIHNELLKRIEESKIKTNNNSFFSKLLDYPDFNNGDKVKYLNSFYKNTIFFVTTILCLFNLYTLLQGNNLAILPIIVQASIIILMIIKSPYQLIILKIWILLLLIGGSAGCISNILKLSIGEFVFTSKVVTQIFSLILGIYLHTRMMKSILIIPKSV